jgi:hypothetical protein
VEHYWLGLLWFRLRHNEWRLVSSSKSFAESTIGSVDGYIEGRSNRIGLGYSSRCATRYIPLNFYMTRPKIKTSSLTFGGNPLGPSKSEMGTFKIVPLVESFTTTIFPLLETAVTVPLISTKGLPGHLIVMLCSWVLRCLEFG